MARVHTVKKARKEQGHCRCGKKIEKGDSYKWVAFRYGPRVVKCGECNFRASELTQSKMSSVYAAQENVEDFLATWEGDVDDLRSEVESACDDIEAVRDEYQEAADNQRDTFPDSPSADENEQKAEDLDGWLDDIRAKLDEFEAFDGERDDDDNPVDADAFAKWRTNVHEEMLSVLGDCPC